MTSTNGGKFPRQLNRGELLQLLDPDVDFIDETTDEIDFIDETVARITDADIDKHLGKVLGQAGYGHVRQRQTERTSHLAAYAEDVRPKILPRAAVKGDPEAAQIIRSFNASNPAHEDLWIRMRQASYAAREAVHEREAARFRAQEARNSYLAVRAEYPHRRAPLLRQVLIAALTLALDAVACWFAAQALGNGQIETLLWTVLFLAVLAAGEVALDHYSERPGWIWRGLAVGLGAFVIGLVSLRFLYLDTAGTVGPAAVLVDATLFTACTAGLVAVGYRALRAAEKLSAWRARRWSRQAEQEAAAASNRAARLLHERDRLADAYIRRVRGELRFWPGPW